MSDAFWGALFAAAPILLGLWLTHVRQMASIAANRKATEEGTNVVISAADKIAEAADKQVKTAADSAVVAKTAAKDARENAQDAKFAAGTTTTAIKNLSGDVNQLKEIVNGYLTERMMSAHKAGYAMGVNDTIGKTVEEHGQRIGSVETKLAEVQSDVKTVLEIVKAANGDRTQVRGESR